MYTNPHVKHPWPQCELGEHKPGRITPGRIKRAASSETLCIYIYIYT